MALRDDISRRIEKKREEIFSLEIQIKEARAYVQALEDMIKMLPRETIGEAPAETFLRPNSTIAKAREAILAAGRPLHIQDILSAVGKPQSKEARAALSGSLASYVRRAEIFTRPAPNTFGLIEINRRTRASTPSNGHSIPEPPPDFGQDDEVIEEERTA